MTTYLYSVYANFGQQYKSIEFITGDADKAYKACQSAKNLGAQLVIMSYQGKEIYKHVKKRYIPKPPSLEAKYG